MDPFNNSSGSASLFGKFEFFFFLDFNSILIQKQLRYAMGTTLAVRFCMICLLPILFFSFSDQVQLPQVPQTILARRPSIHLCRVQCESCPAVPGPSNAASTACPSAFPAVPAASAWPPAEPAASAWPPAEPASSVWPSAEPAASAWPPAKPAASAWPPAEPASSAWPPENQQPMLGLQQNKQPLLGLQPNQQPLLGL